MTTGETRDVYTDPGSVMHLVMHAQREITTSSVLSIHTIFYDIGLIWQNTGEGVSQIQEKLELVKAR
jgi:hypothetical protein